MLTVNDVWENIVSCGDHPPTVPKEILEGIENIIAMGGCSCQGVNREYKTCDSYCDSNSFGIGKIKDGRFLVCSEWSDTTGHGCQCNGVTTLHESLEDALLMGLSEEDRNAAKKELSL